MHLKFPAQEKSERLGDSIAQIYLKQMPDISKKHIFHDYLIAILREGICNKLVDENSVEKMRIN